MKKLDPVEILENGQKLKTDMRIPRKILKDAYKEELQRLKTFEKMLKPSLNSRNPITEGDLCLGLTGMIKELQGILLQIHISHLQYVNLVQNHVENNLMIQFLASMMQDFAKESKIKSVQRKLNKMQKFQDHIINYTEQKSKKTTSQATPWYIK